MSAARIIAATLLAPCLAVLPYLAFAYYALTHFAAEGGAPAQGMLAWATLVLIGAVLAMIFLVVARLSWKKKSMVVRQHLFGWPIGVAFLFLVLLAVPAWLQDWSALLIVVATAGACCAFGIAAARFWLKWSYEDEENA